MGVGGGTNNIGGAFDLSLAGLDIARMLSSSRYDRGAFQLSLAEHSTTQTERLDIARMLSLAGDRTSLFKEVRVGPYTLSFKGNTNQIII